MVMLEAKGALRQVPWAQVAVEHFGPRAAERARALAARLHPHFPDATSLTAMLARIVAEFAEGRGTAAVLKLEPRVGQLPSGEQSRALAGIGGTMLAHLFEGALLERGASVDPSLGAPCLLLALGGEVVPAAKIGHDAVHDDGARATLRAWLARLEGAA